MFKYNSKLHLYGLGMKLPELVKTLLKKFVVNWSLEFVVASTDSYVKKRHGVSTICLKSESGVFI